MTTEIDDFERELAQLTTKHKGYLATQKDAVIFIGIGRVYRKLNLGYEEEITAKRCDPDPSYEEFKEIFKEVL
jgi:hypothetical protein